MGQRTVRRTLAIVSAATVLVLVLPLFALSPADAHGAPTRPGSRTYLCRIDGTSNSGDIEPNNPACAEAVAIGGKQPLWDWFGVLRGDGAGRTRGYIPDGQLCSGGEPKFGGYDLARADWPYTSLTAGSDLTFRYNAWAAHPGQFRMYITKDGFDPTKPLAWDDLEAEPFSVYDQSQPNGTDDQNNTPDYQWTATLPQKSGQHIIYSIWERSDSAETFYGCSDVRFDGGSGQVVGLGPGANPVGDPGSAGPATTIAPTPDATIPAPADPGSTPADGQPGAEGSTPDGAMPEGQSGTGEAATGVADGADGQPVGDQSTDPAAPADGSDPSVAGQAASTGDGQTGAPPASPPAPGDAAAAGAGAEAAGADESADGSAGGGIGRWTALLIGLGGAVIGAGATAALIASRQARSWEARRLDHERVQPPWDRIDQPETEQLAPFRPLTPGAEIIETSRR